MYKGLFKTRVRNNSNRIKKLKGIVNKKCNNLRRGTTNESVKVTLKAPQIFAEQQ